MTESSKPSPGWYDDPGSSDHFRWWDGYRFTDHLAPKKVTKRKSLVTAYLLLVFLGGLGIHRFYLGRRVSGAILLIFTVVAVLATQLGDGGPARFAIPAVWQFVDLFLLPGIVKKYGQQKPRALRS